MPPTRNASPTSRGLRYLVVALVVLLVALTASRLALQRVFTHYEHAPELEPVPKLTENARHVPGDPVNIALVGSAAEVAGAFRAAGWAAADPLTWRSKIAIARSVLRHRPDSTAPVSRLYLFGRAEDLTFEREVGVSAARRHHIRLWKVRDLAIDGRPVWVGAASFDVSAGISHRGLHPTHHIARAIDQERDTVLANLATAGQLTTRFQVTGVGPRLGARNAEGDPYDTDGELAVGVIAPGNLARGAPTVLADPQLVTWKNAFLRWTQSR